MRYRDDVRVYDGVDYYWLPSLFGALWLLWRETSRSFGVPVVVRAPWCTVSWRWPRFARLLGAQIVTRVPRDSRHGGVGDAGDRHLRGARQPTVRRVDSPQPLVHSGADVEPVQNPFSGLAR